MRREAEVQEYVYPEEAEQRGTETCPGVKVEASALNCTRMKLVLLLDFPFSNQFQTNQSALGFLLFGTQCALLNTLVISASESLKGSVAARDQAIVSVRSYYW